MAATAEQVRRAQSSLSAAAVADLRKVWPKLMTMRPDKVAEALALVLEEFSAKYGTASAALAAEWFEERRDLAGATGSFRAQVAALPSEERLKILARWGVGPLFGANPDPTTALSLVSGGLSRTVLMMGRDTIHESIAADPAGPRYARHASANACAFCAMLASRGAVYTSEANAGGVTGENLGGTDYRKARRLDGGVVTAERRAQILAGSRKRTIDQGGRKGRVTKRPLGEKYHDACRCTPVAVWPGQEYEPAPYVEKWRDAYLNAPARPGERIDLSQTLASMRAELGTN